jgi:hypothetical protein
VRFCELRNILAFGLGSQCLTRQTKSLKTTNDFEDELFDFELIRVEKTSQIERLSKQANEIEMIESKHEGKRRKEKRTDQSINAKWSIRRIARDLCDRFTLS